MNAQTVTNVDVDGNTSMPEPLQAPEHTPDVTREVAGELVIPGQVDENRKAALARLRKVLGKQDAHFNTVQEARVGLALVWNDLAQVEGSFSQQRVAQLVEIFQQNEQAVIKQSLDKEGMLKGTTDYVRLSELNSIFNCYLLVGADALESATFDSKGLPHSWADTKKAITAKLGEGRKAIKQRMIVVGAEMKVKQAMKLPAAAELSADAATKARAMADEEIATAERQEQLKQEAKKTPQGIAQTIAASIVRACKFTDQQGIEKIDDAKLTTIVSGIAGAVQTEVTAFANKAAEAEKKAAETVKH